MDSKSAFSLTSSFDATNLEFEVVGSKSNDFGSECVSRSSIHSADTAFEDPDAPWVEAAERYGAAVEAHVEQRSSRSYLMHANFRWFALFLQGRLQPPNGLIPEQANCLDNGYSFASIHEHTTGADAMDGPRIKHIKGRKQLQQLVDYRRPRKGGGQTLFLRGFPTRDSLKVVGSQYGVDPEFFRRHMEFKIPTEKYFDLPSLPSANDNIIKLHMTTIGRRTSTTTKKEEGLKALEAHWEELKLRNSSGQSIVRRFSNHFDRYFSIEQHINICVTRDQHGGWTCIILSDSGRELKDGPPGPWFEQDQGSGYDDVYLPTLIATPTDLTAKPKTPVLPRASSFNCTQTLSDMHGEFASHGLDPRVCAADPFYALHNIYRLTAAAESQFLNMLQVLLDDEYVHFNNPDRMQESFGNLKYQKEILHDHVQQLMMTVADINKRGSPNWPRAEDTKLHEIADRAATLLLKDFEHLLERAQRLSRECAEGVEDVRNASALAEARKGINQAHIVGRLTMLASVFVPLSFTTSFFGMNFRELGADDDTHSLRIWVWFAVTLPLFVAALLFCLYHKIRISRYSGRRHTGDLTEKGFRDQI